MKRTVIALGLAVLLAVIWTVGELGVTPALANGKTHANVQEALEHLEEHVKALREAIKAGHKMNPAMEKGLIFDIEHLEKMIDDELAKAKKKQ